MAIVDYSKQDEFDLVHTGQDCMGWTVVDQGGSELGKVTEMLIDTDRMHVDSIIINGMKRVEAGDIALRDGRVVVRGVQGEEHRTQTVTTETTETTAVAAPPPTYAALPVPERNPHYVSGMTRQANEGEVVLPIVEERLAVGKRAVEGGGVRVHTEIQERPVEEQVRLREEHVVVERNPVNRAVTGTDATAAFQDGEIVLTERAEVPVVAKEARVVEEVVIGKDVQEHTETVRDTVRRTDVEVEEINTTANVNTDVNRRNS